MQIGEAARTSGVSAKMIRYYEANRLIPRAARRTSNYREYGAEDVQRLKFVRRARSLGFSIEEIRSLLALWTDRGRSNAQVKSLALEHARDLEARARMLEEMAALVRDWAGSCRGDGRPQCPILDHLENG
jgi:MerR family transcriptional regulator, copper efflux regulator